MTGKFISDSKSLKRAHVRQSKPYSCGRASAAIVLRLLGHEVREKDVSLPADPEEGCSPDSIVKFFKKRGFRLRHKIDGRGPDLISSLEWHVNRNLPVIVAYQDWADVPSNVNYHKTFDNGHYSVLVGYDDSRFWFIDPSSVRKKRSLEKNDFIGRWKDMTSDAKLYHNWGLAVQPRG